MECQILQKSDDLVRKTLKNYVKEGSITLVCGAGISKASADAFPGWSALLERLSSKLELDPIGDYRTDTLLKKGDEIVDCVPDRRELRSIIHSCLYQGIESFSLSLMKVELLSAIGALSINGSRESLFNILTYNYDDLLEWYLRIHGLRTQSIHSFPTRFTKADVRIFHPHGIVPFHEPNANSGLVFSKKDYDELSRMKYWPWENFQVTHLSSSVSFIIGMSGNDPHLDILFSKIDEIVPESENPVLGFLVIKRPTTDEELKAMEQLRKSHNKVRLLHVYIDDYREIPSLIHEIIPTL